MDTFLAICQAIGLAAAAGLAPFVTLAVVALLAAANFGIDLEGTSFEFIESGPALLLAALVLLTAGASWVSGPRDKLTLTAERPVRSALIIGTIAGGVLGWIALEGEGDIEPLIGALIGAPIGALVATAGSLIFLGAASRLEGSERNALGLFVDLLALVATVLALVVSPVATLLLIAAVTYLPGARRRASSKYEGLRVLR